MAVVPDMNTKAKDAMADFVTSLVKEGHSLSDIWKLRQNLKSNLPEDVQIALVEKLNKDPDAAIAEAKKQIKANPNLLAEINKDPKKIASVMGVAAPAAPASTQTAGGPGTTTAAPPSPAAAPAQTASAQAAPQPSPVAVAAKPAVEPTPAQLKEMEEELKLTAELRDKPGYKGLIDHVAKNPSLDRAFSAMMTGAAGKSATGVESLREMKAAVDKDPEFFKKALKTINEIPEQFRESVFSQIAENPEQGRAALRGDQGAKMNLMVSSMMRPGGPGIGGLFSVMLGGGAGGGLDFGKFLGDGNTGSLGAIGNLLSVILKAAFEMFMPSMKKMAEAPALQNYGPGSGALLASHARTVDRVIGSDSSQKPVYDATKPGTEPTPMAQLGQDKQKPDQAQPVPARPELAQLDQKKVQQIPGMPTDPTAFA